MKHTAVDSWKKTSKISLSYSEVIQFLKNIWWLVVSKSFDKSSMDVPRVYGPFILRSAQFFYEEKLFKDNQVEIEYGSY